MWVLYNDYSSKYYCVPQLMLSPNSGVRYFILLYKKGKVIEG